MTPAYLRQVFKMIDLWKNLFNKTIGVKRLVLEGTSVSGKVVMNMTTVNLEGCRNFFLC